MLKLMCVDPSLVRLDHDSPSDLTRMETIIDGLIEGTKKHFQDPARYRTALVYICMSEGKSIS